MWNKFVLLFFMFGCWLKYLEYPSNIIFYNVWFTLVFAWIVLNILGLLAYLCRKKPVIAVSERTKAYWVVLNTMSAVSFYLCNEAFITIAFVLSSILFMFVVLFTVDKPKKKKRK